MKPIGPETEAGAAVVPTTEAERLEWLVRLLAGNIDSRALEDELRHRLVPAAKAWTAQVDREREVSAARHDIVAQSRDDVRALLATAHEELAEARARIAQLEEALASAGREVENVAAASPFLVEREADGRWLATFEPVPGAMAYGGTVAEARAAASQVVAHRCEELTREVGDLKLALASRLGDGDALAAEREAHADAVQRHAVEMGQMRSALLHLCVQLEREIRRGGGA